MKQQQFEQQWQDDWVQFEQRLLQLERRKTEDQGQNSYCAEYRRVCQHLALAQERGYSSHLIERLQQLAQRGHQQLYRQRSQLGGQLLAFLFSGLPQTIRQQWRSIAVASLLFYGSLIGMGVLVYLFPELVYSVVDPEQVEQMESMYDPEARRLGHFSERNSGDDWQMFGFYIMNNIGIAFQTFASGLLFGLGSLFFLFFNGLMIGAVAGHLSEIGYGSTFWSFVIGHGAFELTAITFAGAAGLQLGWALLAPGRNSRSEALRLAAAEAVKLVAGVILFLLIAAFIEAYWSSMTYTSAQVKLVVGAALWLLVASYCIFAGRQHAPD